MMEFFYIANALFFGMIAAVMTVKFFFDSVPYKLIPLWLGSFIWSTYCISQVVA